MTNFENRLRFYYIRGLIFKLFYFIVTHTYIILTRLKANYSVKKHCGDRKKIYEWDLLTLKLYNCTFYNSLMNKKRVKAIITLLSTIFLFKFKLSLFFKSFFKYQETLWLLRYYYLTKRNSIPSVIIFLVVLSTK